jgi:hypothetical protein
MQTVRPLGSAAVAAACEEGGTGKGPVLHVTPESICLASNPTSLRRGFEGVRRL